MKHIYAFIRKEPVLVVASVCALVSMFFVPPDRRYIEYIDFKTLLCLFCLMVSLKGVECEGAFAVMSAKLALRVKNLRALTYLLVYTCFITSMFITNDVALIAFVPVTLAVFSMFGVMEYAALAIVLQTLAANMGSSLTPIGNPQNLYLFMHYPFTPGSFLLTTAPFVLFGGGLLAVACLLVPRRVIKHEPAPLKKVRSKPVAAYGLMFIVAVAAVFNLVPYWAATAAIALAALLIDRHVLMKVDYSLLLTFVVIFTFVGNIARVGAVYDAVSYWTQRDCMLTAVVSSQFISNVPAAVMLSEFTGNGAALLVGVSIGGIGTPIASMASVISLRLYAAADQKGVRRYLGLFTVLNLVILVLSVVFVRYIV